ncbi:MAG: ABC transporter permease [Bacteroidales bacterium]|nr:MAG: ABC transporter permease [Bacteroidales bacterium]
MIRYFFKLALRNIRKYRVNSVINLVGLSVAFAAFILIANVVRFDLSFDKYHEKAGRIYRVEVDFAQPQGTAYLASTPFPMAAKLLVDYPEVENCFRTSGRFRGVFKYNELSFYEENGLITDNSIFNILTIEFVKGSSKDALKEVNSIVLTEKFAAKYFGEKNPIGESILFNNKDTYKVTGVIHDFPENSSFRPDYLGNIESIYPNSNAESWNNHTPRTYILLKEGVNHKEFNAKIKGFLNQFKCEYVRQLYLNPLTRIHTNPAQDHNIWSIIYLFSATAFFILLIASLNFITLTNANIATRYKEIKVQKILGSRRIQLFTQHIGESLLIAFISFDLGLFMAERAFTTFCGFLNKTINISFFLDINFILILLLIALLIGFISGLISVTRIISFRPIWAMGNTNDGRDTIRLSRKIPVIVQFLISIVLIISTIVAYKQISFLKNKDLGFDNRNLIVCDTRNIKDKINELEVLKQELLGNSNIEAVSLSNSVPYLTGSQHVYKKVGESDDNPYQLYRQLSDPDYLKVYNLSLAKGDGFTKNQELQDSKFCIINETAAQMLGWENPIGKQIEDRGNLTRSTVIGVVTDYHIYSIQDKIPPLYVELIQKDKPSRYLFAIVRTNANRLNEGKKFASDKLKEIFPELPNTFFELDDNLNGDAINSAEGIGRVLGFFSIIGIVIACMGVFGLVAITVKQKTKEIGIRKVLGASVTKIFGMISREFLILLAIANILAISTALYVLDFFLQNFAYKTTVQITDFVIAIVLSIVFTLLAISYHAIKAARANPVESIKWE